MNNELEELQYDLTNAYIMAGATLTAAVANGLVFALQIAETREKAYACINMEDSELLQNLPNISISLATLAVLGFTLRPILDGRADAFEILNEAKSNLSNAKNEEPASTL